MSRTSLSKKNIITGIGSQILLAILSLFTTKIIKTKLGFEYLGLSGVLGNVLSFLSLAELGIGSAITFALYKPLAENDERKIISLMQFYRKAYGTIASIVLVIGLLVIPFLHIFVHTELSQSYVIYIYLLLLGNSVASYLISYKRSIISADQKNYIITLYTFIFSAITKILQLGIVIFTESFALFNIAGIISTLLLNYLISLKANKMYPYLLKKEKISLEDDTKKMLFLKVKSLFMHSIGTFVLLGTDNILISFFLGIAAVGKYGVYLSIVSMMNLFIDQIYAGLYNSIGNFIAEKKSEDIYGLYKKIDLLNSLIQIFTTICFTTLISPFIIFWLGQDSLLTFRTTILISLNFFIGTARRPIVNFKSAAGLFEQDRYAPLIEATLNIIISITLGKLIGLDGIILGTIISNLLIPILLQPYIVYKYLFGKKVLEFFLVFIRNLTISSVLIYIILKIQTYINIPNAIAEIIVLFTISIITSLFFMLLIFGHKILKFFIRKN